MNGSGWFWRPGNEPRRVRGDFVAETEKEAEVILDGPVAEDPSVTTTTAPGTGELVVTELGNPKEVVAAFAPTVLHGELDSGKQVTLLGARNHAAGLGPLGQPHYVAVTAVLGAHVPDDQLYGAIRFRLDAPVWTDHLADGQASTVPDDGSVLRADKVPGGTWLVYESAAPASQRELGSRVVLGCRTLARLAFDLRLTIREAQVSVGESEDWLTLHSPAYCAPTTTFAPSLLDRTEFTIERLARWIALNDKMDGLARAASEPLSATVQAQVLVYTSLVEGIHRRLDEVYPQYRFPGASKGAVDRVGKAASEEARNQAGREKKIRPDDVYTAVRNAVVPLGDVDYRARAQDIVGDVARAVPEFAECIPDLVGELVHARNNMAHHLLAGKTQSLADRIDRLVVISYATPWLLRLLLLLRIGVDPEVLRKGCLGSQRFAFYCENVADVASGLGWPPA